MNKQEIISLAQEIDGLPKEILGAILDQIDSMDASQVEEIGRLLIQLSKDELAMSDAELNILKWIKRDEQNEQAKERKEEEDKERILEGKEADNLLEKL